MDWNIIVQGLILFSGVVAVILWLILNFLKKQE
jgi:hypothetical protein